MNLLPNPWVLLGIVLAWAASLGAVGYWQHEAGVTSERDTWQGKQIAELKAANAEIARLNDKARETEHQHALEINAIGVKDAKDRAALEAQHRDDLARVRAGTLRLRIAGACPKRPDPGPAAEARPAPAGGDDSTAGELPAAASNDLLDLTADADRNTIQLTACQAVIEADRKAVNGP